MHELMVAVLAFAGATAAQVFGHYLEIRRKALADNRRCMVLVDALTADLSYIAVQLTIFVYKLTPSTDIEGWWSYAGSRWDFVRLHRRIANHAGIISCTPDSDFSALAARIHVAITSAGDMTGQHIRVNRPP